MKKRILSFALALILCISLSVTALASESSESAAGFNAGLTVDRSNEANGSFTVAVVADAANNAILASKQPTLSVPCTYAYVQVTGPNGTVAATVAGSMVSFTVAAGGTYTVQQLFAVTFDANGGSCETASAPCSAEGKLAELPTPTRGGYTFNGWFTDASGGTQVDADTVFAKDCTVYAQWTLNYVPSVTPGTPSTPTTSTETTKNEDGSTTTTVTDSKTGTVTETTENVDGSVTTVETKKDGTVTETVENTDGSTVTTETKTDGTTSTTAEQADGTTATAVTDAGGKTEAQVTVSQAAVEAAAESGAAVALPIPAVTTTTESAAASTVTVTTNSETGTKVEIPVANVSTSTVAILVDADGNETVITTTKTTENGIAVTVPDGATVKIVDNSTAFVDVGDKDWEKDAVNFASARGLVNGVGNDSFDLDGITTRGQVMTLLARLAGVDTTPGEGQTWYDKGREWAMANGISDGTFVDRTITRDEMMTMLWRYAGSPESDHDISHFTDAHELSAWTEEAARWAVEIGLVGGHGNGTMTPKGDTTRGQLAQFMMNFIQLM